MRDIPKAIIPGGNHRKCSLLGVVVAMTTYQEYMDQHDFYETEARLTKNPLKYKIFKALAKEYKDKALSLTIEEAMR